MRITRSGKLACALMAFPMALMAAGPEGGTATGQLVVGGRSTPLVHAYARAQRDTLDRTKERILVVLSDVALPPEEFLEQFPGLKLARAGKAHVVTAEIRDDRSVGSSAILHEAFADSDAFCGSASPTLRARTFDAKTAAGTLATPQPGEFQGKAFRYEAAFQAAVWRRPAPTATGDAAARTDPGKAALAFVAAATSRDKAAVKRLLAPGTEAARALDGPQAKDVLEVLGSVNPPPAAAKIASVWVLGDGAEVTIAGKAADGESSHTMILVHAGGGWRVEQEMTDSWF